MGSSFMLLLGLLIAFECHVLCQDEWEFFAHEPYYIEVGYQKKINATIEDKDLSIPANIKSSCSHRYSPTGKWNFIIDLHYERNVYYYVIDKIDHGGTQTKIRVGSNTVVDQNKACATDENCQGQKGQYFAIMTATSNLWQICSVYLKSVYFKAPGPKSGNPTVMSASYIRYSNFYGSHYISSGIISSKHGTNILYSIDDSVVPATWFTAKLDHVSYVESFWYQRANYGSSTTTVTVAHQVYSSAQFLFYKENGKTKIFSLPNTNGNYKEYQFTIPFIARNVRFHLFFDQVIPPVAFLLRVKKASYPIISHHYIASETFSPPFSATLTMKLKNEQLITSVAAMSQTLYSYCISYEYNGKQFTHKINPSQTEGSIFFSNQEIALSSFHSQKVTMGCLVWYDSGVSDITIHFKGLKRNQPDHLWHQSYLISTTSDRAFGTQRYPDYSNSNFSLIGTTDNFRKVAPEHVVKSNFIAGDALTQPDLGSFSIGFQMKSKMSIKPDKLTLRPQVFCIHGDNPECYKAKIKNEKQGGSGKTKTTSTMMLFGNIHYNTHCHFSRVNLKLGKIIDGTIDASVEVFIAASYADVSKGHEVSYLTGHATDVFNMYNNAKTTKKEFILSSTKGSQQVVDITGIWVADTPRFSVIETLIIMLKPKSDDNVPVIEMDHNFELEILDYQIIIPQSIGELSITSQSSYSWQLVLEVDKVMVATGLKIVDTYYLGDLYCAFVSTLTRDEVTYHDVATNHGEYFHEVAYDFQHWQGELSPDKKSCFKMRNGINLNERFVDFPQPFKFKRMTIVLAKWNNGENKPSNLNVRWDSMKILGGEFDPTSDLPPINYPIFSAGLHDQNPNTGVNIFLNQTNNMISADVQTKSKRYHVETRNTGVNEYSIVTVVWKNAAYLRIYVDDTLKNEDTSGRSNIASVDYQKNYYVFFGYYEFAFSYLHAKFQFFFVMRKEITGSDAMAMFEEADFFPIHPKSTGSLLLGPNCICKSSICPCETGENLVNQTFSPYTYTLSQYQSDTLYYSTMQFYDSNRKSVRLIFPITGMDLKYFKITDARLKFKVKYSFHTCFSLSWYNGNYGFYRCQTFNSNEVYETNNIADYITWIAKKSYIENNNKLIFYFESSNSMSDLPTSVALVLTTAEPSSDLLWYEPAYNGALNTLPTRKEFFTTNANFRMNCLKFSVQFVGDGFAFVVITRETDESIPIMTLLPQNYKAWTEISISIASAAITKFHLTFIRSGSGDGYFAIKNLRTLPNDVGCKSFEDYQAVTTTYDNLKNALESNNLPVPLFIAPSDQDLNPLYDSSRVIASNSVPSKSYNMLMDSYLLPKKSKGSDFTISIEEKLHDFTLAAMFQSGFVKIIFQSVENEDQTILEISKVSNTRKMNLTITNVASNATQETIMAFRKFPDSMDFFGLQYSSFFKRVCVRLNKDHHDVYWNLNLTDITTMAISTKNVVCLQFYNKILDAMEYEVTKLCPTYISTDICAGIKPGCHAIFCNPTTGKFEWKESRRFYNEDCSHAFDDTLDTTGYFPMDYVNNSGFIENVKDGLSIEFNHTFMSLSEPGVVDNALCYKSEEKTYLIKKGGLCSGRKCSFSVWLKHACVTDGHLFTIQQFTVRCKANGEVEIQVGDCIYTYMFSTSFWYHLAGVIKSQKLESFYYNGQQKNYKSKVCNADRSENNFLIFGNIPFCVDELTYSEKAYDSEFVYNRYMQSKEGNATTLDEIKRQSSQLHIYYGDYDQIGYIGYHENYMFLPPYLQGFRDRFQSETRNALQHIEFANMWHGTKPIAVCYFRMFDGLSWQSSGIYDFASGSESFSSSEAAIPENDIKRSSEKAVAQSYTIIDVQKTNVTISWNHLKEYISDRSYPLIGIKVMVTSNLPTMYLEVFSPTFLIDQLRPFKYYTLHLIPISTKGIAQNRYLRKSFTTPEGEPYAAPHLTCSSIDINEVNGRIISTIHDITTEEYGGTPYSLQYFLYDSNNITDPSSLDTWNLPQALSEKEYLRSAISSGSSSVSFHTESPYHDYVIVSRATTQNGNGFGILSYLTCKSAEGAAEYPPTVLNASTEYDEGESFNVNWIPLPDDDEVWNSNQRQYAVRFGYIYLRSSQNDFRSSSSFFSKFFSTVTQSNGIFKLTEIVADLPSSNTEKIPDYKDNVYRFYVGTRIKTAAANYYSVNSPYYCIALKNQNAPRSLELNSYPTPMNSTSVHFHFKKQNPLFWRGMKKFFVVLATQCPEKNCTVDIPILNISKSIYTFCLNYSNPNATNELKPTHLSKSNFRHYCHHIDVGNDIEGFIEKARPCSELEYVPRKWNDQKFTIDGLLHYRMYKLNVYACNEFNCTLTSDNNTETHQYIPTYPPAGFTHNALTSTSIKFYWNEIDEYHQNGIILNYTINLRRTRTNDMIYNTTFNRSIVYENLEKYEKVCISVAGVTIIGEGVRSLEYCAYTAEDAPSIAPNVSKVELHSHHIGIWVNKPPSVYSMNGIVREIKAVFVPSANNTYSIYGNTNSKSIFPTTPPLLMRKRRSVEENEIERTLPAFYKTWYINHEHFFRTLEDKHLTLNSLAAYTQYDMSLVFKTILDGEVSSSLTFRTLQSVPLEAPHSVEVDYFNATFFNITWEPLQLHLWAGIPYEYCVVVDEFWRNSSVQTNRFCYESNTLDHSSYYLQPFTINQVAVFACTSIGCSSLGVKTSVLTNESAPVGLINNLTYSLTSTSLKLNWTDVEIMQQYGVVTGYKLTIVASDNLHPPIETFVNVSEVLFSNLREYTWYVVTIQAVNSAGDGPSYVEHYRTLEDVPSAPPNETLTEGIDANRILITWNNVPYHHRNGIIQGYLIYYHHILLNGSLGPRQVRNINDSLIFSYILDGLVKGESYNISMAAYTSIGVGVESEMIFSETGDFDDGNWTLWTEWGGCSATCGGGIQIRTRECENPRPFNGGANCTGISVRYKECGGVACSGIFLSEPGNMNCTKFCLSVGTLCQQNIHTENTTDVFRKNNVTCSANTVKETWTDAYDPVYKIDEGICKGYVSVPDIIQCDGNSSSDMNTRRVCNCLSQDDIGFSIWGQWSPCVRTCHVSSKIRAFKQRRRACLFPKREDQERMNICTGVRIQKADCEGVTNCPVDGNWGEWTEFGPCNQTCNYGYRKRTRECDNPRPKFGGEYCKGFPESLQLGGCNNFPCPVHGGYSNWEEWSYCQAPCGNSTRYRRRFCNSPTPNYRGRNCDLLGHDIEHENCTKDPCPNVDMICELRLYEKYFDWHFNYIDSKESRELQQMIKDHFWKEFMSRIEFEKFRKGSVIAEFTIYYDETSHDQVVQLMEETKSQKIGNSSFSDFKINSTAIPCLPPTNITTYTVSQSSLMITFDIPQCHGEAEPMNIYLYYQLTTAPVNSEWTVAGFHPNRTSISLNHLEANMKLRGYLFRATIFGNGPPSEELFMETVVGAPSEEPKNVRAVSVSPTQIFVEWEDIPEAYRNGPLIGYKVRYKTIADKTFQEKNIDFGYRNTLVENLKPFTMYQMEVSGFTRGGEGPLEYVIEKTLEGVPDIPVPNFKVYDMQSVDWWAVSWSEIPKENVNGILRGYRLMYYMSYRSDISIGGEPTVIERQFDIYTFYHKEINLVNYATYNVTVTGFTNAGNGPVPEYFAKTCKCLKDLYSFWYPLKPYVETNGTHLSGFFPGLIKDLIEQSCGSCKDYEKSTLHFMVTRTGDDPNWLKELNLKLAMSPEVDVGFPFYSKPGRTVAPDTIYIQINPSIGFTMLVRDEAKTAGKVDQMILNVLKVWPLLLVSYCIATLFGILIWFTDQFMNPDEFNIGSSIKGPVIGFWFSFVTMTTVGYGDLTPRSILARSIAMVWFLVGLILNGIVIGFIATALTSVGLPEELTLYDSKAGVILDTYEYRYAIRKNAIVSDNVTYENVTSMLKALQESEVDLVIADAYQLGDVKSQLPSMNLKVKKTIDEGTGYGFALSGQSKVLKPDIEGLLLLKNPLINKFIKSMEDKVPRMELEQPGEATKDIFSAEADAFQKSAIYMCSFIAVGTVLGIAYTCYKNNKKKIQVSPTKIETNAEEFRQLGLFIKETYENLCEITDRYGNLHKEEIEKLASFKKAYKRKVNQVGSKEADKIVFDAFG